MPERLFLTARWKNLAMLSYEVPPSLLLPDLPIGTELDDWNGKTLVSVVALQFFDTRVLGVPVPFHRSFAAVNFRFYVRRRTDQGWRRGVSFLRGIVPRYAIATVARLRYNEPFVHLPVRYLADAGAPTAIRYQWGRSESNQLTLQVSGDKAPAAPASKEAFVTQRLWGYVRRRDGRTAEFHVERQPWSLWQVSEAGLQCDVAALFGVRFVDALLAPPLSALLADGSAVGISRPIRIT